MLILFSDTITLQVHVEKNNFMQSYTNYKFQQVKL